MPYPLSCTLKSPIQRRFSTVLLLLTAYRTSIKSCVKEIVVMAGDVLLRCTVPMPDGDLTLGRVTFSVTFLVPFYLVRGMVGHPGLEPGTSVLSGLRSNHLS